MTDSLAAHDILLILSPPIALIDWLERVWADKQAKGQEVPESFTKWLERWRAIRADGSSDVDYVTPAEWAGVGKLVQPALIEVQQKKVYA